MKKCPFCAEEIQDDAKKCKHCGEFLTAPPTPSAPPATPAAPPAVQAKSGVWDGVKIGVGIFIVLPLIILLCVLIFGGFLGGVGSVTSSFTSSFAKNKAKTCIATLKQIDGAKTLYALDTGRGWGDHVTMSDLVPEYIKNIPQCPSGGEYSIKAINETPECSVPGHTLED